MKLFPIRGGIHPEYRKELTSEKAIEALPLPAALYIPLQQHIGAPAEVLVAEGDLVKKGPGHRAPPGRGVGAAACPHLRAHRGGDRDRRPPPLRPAADRPSSSSPTARTNGPRCPSPSPIPLPPTPQAIDERVAAVGHRGHGRRRLPLGGQAEPRRSSSKLETLLINGAECEPYLTCDDRVMREHADEIIDGARIMAHALGAPRVVIAIEENKPQALAAMTRAAAAFPEYRGGRRCRCSIRWAPSATWCRPSPAARPRRASSPPISAWWCTTSPPPAPSTRPCASAAR